ncbi:tyrosine-type recombinase/integrase [Aliirhizobium cellulosilyticum]|uniref:Integrase/recombinase XerD n=1 Tax=Aliirhizobium cellulosilyticum TaxID=393664 RepID=A0A7W6Y0S0_9HYPH|nr:site-specific integrase [Rhizobium cellulosilyticum]MBB4347013.1 integrase/recombinase XerD [Rhizobium cellulosilyticum]MBB4410593.1 integrase/recombinase XerD [Rhizobium cellulosilyticum]MBB4445281.1 integrase/recombinase XerD [Rhizobium cellulosilyticum]
MKQARVLTDAEFKRLLAVVEQMKHAGRNRLGLMLSHLAGLRVGEIAALTLRDVFDCDGKAREQLRLRAEITKGGHARVVFLNGKLRREIERYRAECTESRDADAPLLLTQKKTAFSANTLCQLMGQLYRNGGLDGATSHSGRRWFITRLAHSGVSPKVIMTLAGHRNLTTTQRYIDVRDEMMKAAVDLL